MNPTLTLLQNRKSVRSYSDQPITTQEKQAILSAAMRAPTAGNMMLYSILDITDQALKEKLSQTCDHQPFIAQAPLVLVFCADYRRWMKKFAVCECDGGTPAKPEEGNLLLACSDALIAAQTAVVAAESLDIGSCYIGDILEQAETHIKLLDLPEYVMPITMVVFGHPTPQQRDRKQLNRFPQDMIVFENTYRDLSDEEIQDFAADLE
ncbi:MAG TPA: nitroreductase family protein, partial [Clostridia bacterium]|nr:nitroreductase family protein [Clostridia bacterium]